MAGMSCLDRVLQVDTFPPNHSRTPVRTYRQNGGGPAATAAVAAACLGAEVDLLTLHGHDEAARYLEHELANFGVACMGSRHRNVETPVSTVVVDSQGERYIFPYRDTRLYEIQTGWGLSCLERCHVVLVDNRYPHLCEAVIKRAKHLNLTVVADFGDSDHWHLARQIDHLLISEECALQLCGTIDAATVLSQIRQADSQVVGITLGAKGFYYDDGRGVQHVHALPVAVTDTTGAGDVFHGAYAYALASGRSVAASARFAAVTAALSCRGVGRSAVPKLEEVLYALSV